MAEEPASVTVEDAAKVYLDSIIRLKPTTQQEYTYKLGLFVKWCTKQNIFLSDVNSLAVDRFLVHMKQTHKSCRYGVQEISSSTLASEVRIIKIFLNWCVQDDVYSQYVKLVTVQRIKKVKISRPIIKPFKSEHIHALLDACKKEEGKHLQLRDKAIVAVLLDTGIRASELCTLTFGNVHLDSDDPHLVIFGKGDKWGEVGLGKHSLAFLEDYIRKFRLPAVEALATWKNRMWSEKEQEKRIKKEIEQARVFVGCSGNPLTVNGLHQIIERLGEWSHITGVRCTTHDFRHTFAAFFIQQGGDIYRLSKLLRHSSMAVTEDYLRSLLQSEARKGAKSVLDDLW